jgi:hypothetical protein
MWNQYWICWVYRPLFANVGQYWDFANIEDIEGNQYWPM